MGIQYIGDDRVILKLAGLRVIQKDGLPESYSESGIFLLTWEYKGTKGSMGYENEDARDQMYQRLLDALTGKDKQELEEKYRIPIFTLGLPNFVFNVLKREYGTTVTVGQIARTSDEELLAKRGFGNTSLGYVREAIKKLIEKKEEKEKQN